MRVALIADLHGNWPAVEALEKDLAARRVDKMFCLGDLVGKGPSGDKTFDWAMQNCDVVLGGNWDYGVGRREFPRDGFYWSQLGEKRLSALRKLPTEHVITLSGRRIRLIHGRPVMSRLLTIRDAAEELRPLFTDFSGEICDVLGYADSHRQSMRTLTPGLVFNCGSVGNALGVPLACYAIMEGVDAPGAPLDITMISLPYDRDRAVKDAVAAGEPGRMASYIREVETGEYSRMGVAPSNDNPF